CNLNETKLSNAVRARRLRPATLEEIRATGAEPGFASPIGVDRSAVMVVVDDLVARSPNLVSGANEPDYHYLNVNAGRDYQPDIVADIATAFSGVGCPHCRAPLRLARGVEVGNILKLGTRYSEALGASYLDADGRARPIVMGFYGIGVSRLLACVAEAHHDERGLTLPVTVAPYEVHLVRLGRDERDVQSQADELYRALQAAGVEVLYDDREASPGVKFADADLVGLPLRVTISPRSLSAGGIELKRRDQDAARLVPHHDAISAVHEAVQQLKLEAAARVMDVPYPVAEG
ncbi:MAG: proline--tRNA ligase, partial [Chloroflexota bacterium]